MFGLLRFVILIFSIILPHANTKVFESTSDLL